MFTTVSPQTPRIREGLSCEPPDLSVAELTCSLCCVTLPDLLNLPSSGDSKSAMTLVAILTVVSVFTLKCETSGPHPIHLYCKVYFLCSP